MFFALAGMTSIPHDGEQNGARMKSISPTVSDFTPAGKKSSSYYDKC